LAARYPGLTVAGTHHGYFKAEEEPAVVAKVRQSRADLLFVALGAPRQELWAARHLEALGVPVVMGVGGSFDVLAGKVRRAPVWLRRLYLEWLGRLLMDPKRWRRQLVLPKFVLLVLRRYR
jgi:N-acetylglucosaminyldiphosphoundecaprenol N-acetyl-beta-D-mannosaminyltransferase